MSKYTDVIITHREEDGSEVLQFVDVLHLLYRVYNAYKFGSTSVITCVGSNASYRRFVAKLREYPWRQPDYAVVTVYDEDLEGACSTCMAEEQTDDPSSPWYVEPDDSCRYRIRR